MPTRDFKVWIGNSGTVENASGIVFRMKAGNPPVPVNLTGIEVVFFAKAGTTTIRKTTADGSVSLDAANGLITIPLSVAETRAMSVGEHWSYEVETRAAGNQRTIMSGRLIPCGGINDDA